MKSVKSKGFTLVELLAVLGILGILFTALFPAISNAVLQANMTEVGLRGRDIFVAIASANAQRKILGLDSVWPKTTAPAGGSGGGETDISAMAFNNAAYYFYVLLDGKNIGLSNWSPYVIGVDYSKLSGAGVPSFPGGGQMLQAQYVMWTIGANLRDEMEDIIPILVTRNVNATQLVLRYEGTSTTKVGLGRDYTTPFSNKGFVMIRKSGAIFKARAKYSNLRVIYQGKRFDLTGTTGTSDPMTYLAPKRVEYPAGS
jgi:prepilin-type N-terminal cleavage/methylation domain-containing protein